MLIVVVDQAIVFIVGHFLFIYIITLVFRIGVMALHYALRGGASGFNAYCGIFSIHYNRSSSYANWHGGAHYALRGGTSHTGDYCGNFYVNVGSNASYASWSLGAHYARRGGYSSLGAYCGAFCVSLNGVAGGAYWYYGAALSFKA